MYQIFLFVKTVEATSQKISVVLTTNSLLFKSDWHMDIIFELNFMKNWKMNSYFFPWNISVLKDQTLQKFIVM